VCSSLNELKKMAETKHMMISSTARDLPVHRNVALDAAPGRPLSGGRGLSRLTQKAFDDTEPTWLGQ
jgi:hypothetical protein